MIKPILAAFLLTSSLQALAVPASTKTAPNNSKVNAKVQDNAELTAQDQGTSKSDVETTRMIRQAVVANDALSQSAKNIKIITINGVVTLKGPVQTAAEKRDLQKIAVQTAAGAKVVNEITVE